MGRKIPAKKHRGVKDPLQQQAKRYEMLKSKINAPPKDPDEQPVPRSLTELFSFRDSASRKPKRKPATSASAASNKVNPISRLRKLPGESGRGFSLRINSAIRALHDSEEAQDYPQDLEEEDARGSRMALLRERRQRKTKRAAAVERPAKLSHKDKLKQKKAAAAQEAALALSERPQYERVPFGEVTAAPPALSVPRRAGQHAARPGQRDLLLSKLLPSKPSGSSVPSGVSVAERERRERARLDAVTAYRELKKQKRKQ